VDQYCVVVCGLRAGASDEASTWAPVAAALRMEHDEFSRRVVAALPRIVRQQLDRSSAERIAQLLQGLHVDAHALPGDEELAYIDRDGSSRGPLPRSALDAFIAPGESYRLHGSLAWQIWPEPLEYESSPPPAQAFDEVMAAPVDEAFAAAPAEPLDDEPPAPAAVSASPGLPPPLPTASSPAAVEPPVPGDELATDDALVNPSSDEPVGEADVAAPPAETTSHPPRRSRLGRMLLLLALVGVAAWAYLNWGADTHVDDSPPAAAVGHAQPANSTTAAAAAAAATSAAAAPAMAASTPTASASSTPAAATSVPASGGTAALPAAAATTAAPAAASSAAPAASASAVPAHAASAMATPTTPAAAGSSARG